MYLIDWVQEWAKAKVIGGYIILGLLGVLILEILIFVIVHLIKK